MTCIWFIRDPSCDYCVEIETSGLTDLFHTREYRPRENVTFLENGTKLYALNPKTFVFVSEKSAGNPEVDIVRTVNIPFVVRRCVWTGEIMCVIMSRGSQ